MAMKITPNQDFLIDTKRYEKDKTVSVDDATGAYAVGMGWAEGPEGYTGPGTNQSVRLDIQSTNHSSRAETPAKKGR